MGPLIGGAHRLPGEERGKNRIEITKGRQERAVCPQSAQLCGNYADSSTKIYYARAVYLASYAEAAGAERLAYCARRKEAGKGRRRVE